MGGGSCASHALSVGRCLLLLLTCSRLRRFSLLSFSCSFRGGTFWAQNHLHLPERLLDLFVCLCTIGNSLHWLPVQTHGDPRRRRLRRDTNLPPVLNENGRACPSYWHVNKLGSEVGRCGGGYLQLGQQDRSAGQNSHLLGLAAHMEGLQKSASFSVMVPHSNQAFSKVLYS